MQTPTASHPWVMRSDVFGGGGGEGRLYSARVPTKKKNIHYVHLLYIAPPKKKLYSLGDTQLGRKLPNQKNKYIYIYMFLFNVLYICMSVTEPENL